ncbi:MAG: hypothetical protein QF883_03065, partial [Candidatus Poseidoniia archaeon]|nr:hypothetical protein [Candidatus Poseidoniia archaeon]
MDTRVPLLVALLLFSALPSLAVPPADASKSPWWETYSRDVDRDGISDLLEWKLAQGDRFFALAEARVFVRYDHYPDAAVRGRLPQGRWRAARLLRHRRFRARPGGARRSR